ncbi:hypothetical protein Halru_1781 [Halovivax ruber XH-70]|uniref:Transposase n=1 Tax=Halovivax ruber (strain DSM 18193 / JCM 13892 / XH-70) TaxID=797302 RepID=L0I9X6_HALRX|nr:hypothetical protein Halru_1781 [Halovivax ruber XH-70]
MGGTHSPCHERRITSPTTVFTAERGDRLRKLPRLSRWLTDDALDSLLAISMKRVSSYGGP